MTTYQVFDTVYQMVVVSYPTRKGCEGWLRRAAAKGNNLTGHVIRVAP